MKCLFCNQALCDDSGQGYNSLKQRVCSSCWQKTNGKKTEGEPSKNLQKQPETPPKK